MSSLHAAFVSNPKKSYFTTAAFKRKLLQRPLHKRLATFELMNKNLFSYASVTSNLVKPLRSEWTTCHSTCPEMNFVK